MSINIIVPSFLAGLLCAMGFGSGTVLIIWLTSQMAFTQLQAQGVNLLFFIPCALLSLIILSAKGLVNLKQALPVGVGSIPGIFIGHIVLTMIPAEYLSKLFGVFVIFLGINQLMKTKRKPEKQ